MYNDIEPLDDGSPSQYTLHCLYGGTINLDDQTMSKSPTLKAIFNSDLTTSEIYFPDNVGCTQNTLEMVLLIIDSLEIRPKNSCNKILFGTISTL
jgi:hypothetical protein